LIELAERALYWCKAFLEEAGGAAPDQQPEEQRAQRRERGHAGEDERDARQLRKQVLGHDELRLERLDIRGALALRDHGDDADRHLAGVRGTGLTVRSDPGDRDGRQDEAADAPRGDRVLVDELDMRAARDLLRLVRLHDLERPDLARDRRIAREVPRLGVDDDRERDAVADRNGRAVHRGRGVHRIDGECRRLRDERKRDDRKCCEEPAHARFVRWLKNAMSAGTYGRSVKSSSVSIFRRPSSRRRSMRRCIACAAYSSRSRRSEVSTYAVLPVSASSSATTPTSGSSSSRRSLSTIAMTSCLRPSMRIASSMSISMKSEMR